MAEKRYYVQLLHGVYSTLITGKTYTVSFRAKSKPGTSIVVVVASSAKAPGEMLRQDNITLGEEWKDYSYTFTPVSDSDASRVLISGLAATVAEYWFTDVSLKEGTK